MSRKNWSLQQPTRRECGMRSGTSTYCLDLQKPIVCRFTADLIFFFFFCFSAHFCAFFHVGLKPLLFAKTHLAFLCFSSSKCVFTTVRFSLVKFSLVTLKIYIHIQIYIYMKMLFARVLKELAKVKREPKQRRSEFAAPHFLFFKKPEN